MDIEENIFEPVDLFRARYRDTHAKNIQDFLDELIKKSGVDAEKNAETVKKIKAKQTEIGNQNHRVSGKKILRGFLIFLIVVFSIAAVVFLVGILDPELSILSSTFSWLIIAGCALAVVGLALLIGLKINKIIKGLETVLVKLNRENEALLQEGWDEMAPLNALFDWGMSQELVSKTIPLVKLDPCFDNDRFECLNQKYGLEDNSDPHRSVLYVQSGEMIGNPFVLAKTLSTWTGSQVYTGTLQISWTETHYENGKWVTRTRYQTLTANVTKPLPCYGERTYLVYGNEAAPDLCFSRSSSPANSMNDKEIEKYAQKKGKDIEKMSEKAVTKGGSFTAMAETDFEALFGALDRNDEVQFRLLFTPLAQREMMAIIKDKTVGYGDDFSFTKNHGLNIVEPAHLRNVDMTGDPQLFYSYDLEAIRQKFLDYNNAYFKAFYFAFAPVLAIPIYQQQKPHEYLYKDIYKSRTSCWEHEYMANQLSIAELKHPESITTNVLKTEVVSSTGDAYHIKVTANGNKGVPRVDMVPVLGGDGRMHAVPVPWTEYIPVKKVSDVVVQRSESVTKGTMDYLKGNSQAWKDYFKGNSADMVYRQAVLAFIALGSINEASIGKAGEIIKNTGK